MRDALEVTHVARQYREIVMERRCRNQEIEVGHEVSLFPEERPRLREALHDRITQVEVLISAQKVTESHQMSRRIGVAVSSLVNLADGDIRDVNSTSRQALKCPHRGLPVGERLNNPIAVEEIRQ